MTLSPRHRSARPRIDRRARWLVAFLLLATASAGVRAVSAAESGPAAAGCFDEWWSGRIARAADLARGAASLLPVDLVSHLESTASNPDELLAALDEIARAPGTDPLVAAEIDARLLSIDLVTDDLERAATRRAALGVVERFLVGGPDAGKRPSLPADAPGEDLDPRESWREFAADADGHLPLDALFHPSDSSRASAVFWIEARERGDVALRFGADDAARVEIDGVELDATFGPHDLRFDQHAVFLTLEPGWHRVRFEVEQESGDWGLIVRATALEGGPLDAGLAVRWPEDIAEVEQQIPESGARAWRTTEGRTVSGLLERAARRDGAAASARLALDLHRRQLPDRRESRAIELVRAALEAAPRDPDVLWAASLVEKDVSRRREALERILALPSEQPAAVRRLVHHYVERGNVEAALGLIGRSLARCSEDPYIESLRAALSFLPGAPGLAIADFEGIVTRSSHPGLGARLARLLLEQGLPARARLLLEDLLARRPGDMEALAAMLELTARAGDSDHHRAVLRAAARRQPYNAGWRLRLARSLLADGNPGAAWDELQPLFRINPARPDLLALAGEVRLAAGDPAAAGRLWSSVAEAGTASDQFEDRLAALIGGGGAFGEAWTRSLDEVRALIDERAAELEGDPPVVLVGGTHGFRVQAGGLAERFVQYYYLVRRPERAADARAYSVVFSPGLQRLSVLEARLVRTDGSEYHASQSESPLLPDPELRMWYDTRVVTLAFPPLEAGDIVEVSYRLSDRGPVNQIGEGYFGELIPLGAPSPVLGVRIVLDADQELPIAHSLNHVPDGARVRRETHGSRELTVIDLPDLPAFPPAAMSPPLSERVPYAVVGTVASWERLGTIYAELIGDQLRVSPDIRRVVEGVTAAARSPREIAEELYRWVIENTRYVALELGIHAIKPYDAVTVFERRHGDCKDKSALLVTMLREAGIDAAIALVRTRNQGLLDTSVPTFSAFDHAIVHIPSLDLWLDGTVLHHAARELPLQDRGALALLVGLGDEAPPVLMTTPALAPGHDELRRIERLLPDDQGSVEYEFSVVARGEAAARHRGYLRLSESRDQVLRTLLAREHTDASVSETSFTAIDLDDDGVSYSYTGSIPRLGRRVDGRVSFPMFVDPPVPGAEVPRNRRDVPLSLPTPSRRRVSSTYALPLGARAAGLPRGGRADSPWGRVAVEVRARGDAFEFAAETEFLGGTVPTDRVAEFGAWIAEARQLLEQRFVVEFGQ